MTSPKISPIDKDYLPRDVSKAAIAMGASVRMADLADNHSGFIIRAVKNGPVYIVVNENHSEERVRFTIAHELAHLASHDDGEPFREDRSKNNPSNSEELDANRIAANFLMPEEEVRRLVKLDASVPYMEKRFKVSNEAMVKRLKELDLLDDFRSA